VGTSGGRIRPPCLLDVAYDRHVVTEGLILLSSIDLASRDPIMFVKKVVYLPYGTAFIGTLVFEIDQDVRNSSMWDSRYIFMMVSRTRSLIGRHVWHDSKVWLSEVVKVVAHRKYLTNSCPYKMTGYVLVK